jgi:gluconokinase
MVVIVTGVSGAGKTTIGRALAQELDWRFFDADDYHSPENVARMEAGTPLTDVDREAWLGELEALVRSLLESGEGGVLACSALRESYRARLKRAGGPESERLVCMVFLEIGTDEAQRRVSEREGHFMPSSLIASQFGTLEPPDDALVVDAAQPPDALVREIAAAVRR